MRIAIVNDLKMTVELLRRIVRAIPSYEIAWVAYDGAEAVEKCAKDTPDLILMDLIMPVMGGVEATYWIMKNSPCPILVVTASVNTNASKVFEAMGHGALDAISTPILDTPQGKGGGQQLLEKIETIAYLSGASKVAPKKREISPIEEARKAKRALPNLVVFGSSTGGPLALLKILSQFPKNADFAGVIVQHIDEQFAGGLADWLSDQTELNVELAQVGSKPEVGKVLVAGTNNHLIMTENCDLIYTQDPVDFPYRPSADVFLNSVAKHWPDKGVAVLLTGMGEDGAKGMKTLREKGWYTIAERKQDCVIYGMPKAAIAIQAIEDILALEEIPGAINRYYHFDPEG